MIFPTKADARAFAKRMGVLHDRHLLIVRTTHEHWTIIRRRRLQVTQICSICGESFPEPSNNAQPVNEGRCCAYCDDHVVTLARVAESRRFA